jgi:hypothetical protein
LSLCFSSVSLNSVVCVFFDAINLYRRRIATGGSEILKKGGAGAGSRRAYRMVSRGTLDVVPF